MRLQDLEGQITIGTGDGAVTADDLRGSVAISTGDGSVSLSGRLDELTVRTGDGAVDLNAQPGSTMKSGWNVSTGDGSVRIHLPQDFNADIDAHTGDGGIRTAGVDVINPERQDEDRDRSERRRERRERRDRRDLRARAGSGGEMLTVRTGDGAIDISVR